MQPEVIRCNVTLSSAMSRDSCLLPPLRRVVVLLEGDVAAQAVIDEVGRVDLRAELPVAAGEHLHEHPLGQGLVPLLKVGRARRDRRPTAVFAGGIPLFCACWGSRPSSGDARYGPA
jgi:hypothetical protein